MSFKVVKNALNEVVCFGPATEQYQPTIGAGHTLSIEEFAPIFVPKKAELIKKVDADVDTIYAAAIGNRATEYSEAELQASAFKDAAYSGTVPSYVASWLASNTKGLTTATQAADDIIAQANAWRGAAASIRANRLTAKKNIIDEVPTAMQQWNGFVTAIRAALGI
jgi:hypothetical protein